MTDDSAPFFRAKKQSYPKRIKVFLGGLQHKTCLVSQMKCEMCETTGLGLEDIEQHDKSYAVPVQCADARAIEEALRSVQVKSFPCCKLVLCYKSMQFNH